MWPCGWIATFSLVSFVAGVSVVKETHRDATTKSKHRTLIPEDSVLLNDILGNSEEIQGNDFENSDNAQELHLPRTSSQSRAQLNSSSYATGYQKKTPLLALDSKSNLFHSKPLISGAETSNRQETQHQIIPNFGDLNFNQGKKFFLGHQHAKDQVITGHVDRSSIIPAAEERQSRPHRRPQRPLFNPQRPRRPFFRAASSTLLAPPPRPTSPLPNPPLPNPPLINAPDISSIPLESSEDSGGNGILDERFPPFNDEPFPPFNAGFFNQSFPQLATQDETLSAGREVTETLSHQSPQPQTHILPQTSLQQITPAPQSTPREPLHQINSALQTTLQVSLQQSTPIPQRVVPLPLQQITPIPQPSPLVPLQHNTALSQQSAPLETTLVPRQSVPPSLQQVTQSQPISHPQAQGNIHQGTPNNNSQRQPHRLFPQEPESQRLSQQQFSQSLPNQGFLSHRSQIPQIVNEHIPQLLPPQEALQNFQPINQQFSEAVPRPQQNLFPPPPPRSPHQRPQQFLSSPRLGPSQSRPQRGGGRQAPHNGLRNTRQPRFVTPVRRPRRFESQQHISEQRRPQLGRNSALSSGEISFSAVEKTDNKEDKTMELPSVSESVFSTPPSPNFPKFPTDSLTKFNDHSGVLSPVKDNPTHTYKGTLLTDPVDGHIVGNVKSTLVSNSPNPQHIRAAGKGIAKNIGRLTRNLARRAKHAASAVGKATGQALGEGIVAVMEAVHTMEEYANRPPMRHSLTSGLHLTVPHSSHVNEHKFGLRFSLSSSPPGAGPLPLVGVDFDSDVVSRPLDYNEKSPKAFLKPYVRVTSAPVYHYNQLHQYHHHTGPRKPSGFLLNSDGFLLDDHHSSPHLPEYEINYGSPDPDDDWRGFSELLDYNAHGLNDNYHSTHHPARNFPHPSQKSNLAYYQSLKQGSRSPCPSHAGRIHSVAGIYRAESPSGSRPENILCKTSYPHNIQEVKAIINSPSYPADYYRESWRTKARRSEEKRPYTKGRLGSNNTRTLMKKTFNSPGFLSRTHLGFNKEDSMSPFGENDETSRTFAKEADGYARKVIEKRELIL
ncbi:hypothetical protein SK128_022803 [Halocaridina rubra]|uniref:Uncharacterized protein n=1 Tax=Halocaridina rubra TaxID=373956 RepID=A0AAN9AFL0_HALRR